MICGTVERTDTDRPGLKKKIEKKSSGRLDKMARLVSVRPTLGHPSPLQRMLKEKGLTWRL